MYNESITYTVHHAYTVLQEVIVMNSINDNINHWNNLAPYYSQKHLPFRRYLPSITAQSGGNKRNLNGLFAKYEYSHNYPAHYYRQTLPFTSNDSPLSNSNKIHQIEFPLYPASEEYQMGGIPPGMTKQSFLAGRGSMKITLLDEKRTKIEFVFLGLIPNGVYTLWNVLEDFPNFRDEPLGPEGYGKHGVIVNQNGHAHAVVYLNKRPGVMFLLDYHADGKLTGEKGKEVFPGALWARFPKFD